jgi:hypothetical protein
MTRTLAPLLILLLPLTSLAQTGRQDTIPQHDTVPKITLEQVQPAKVTRTQISRAKILPPKAPKDTTSWETPYNPAADTRTFSIKGKALPWLLGNGGGISFYLGLEYAIAKNQSIGIDAYTEFEQNSDDMVQDTSGTTHQIGDYWNSTEKAIFLEYRYYFNFQRLRKRYGIAPYLLAYVRDGKIDRAYDPLYPLMYYWQDHERHYSAGLQVGAIIAEHMPWHVDVNIGLFEKEKEIHTEFLTHGVVTSTNWRPVEMGFRLSANYVWWWSIPNSHPTPRTPS